MGVSNRTIVVAFITIIIGALLVGGTTIALFNSTASNSINTFQSGTLIVELDQDDGDFYFEVTNITPGDSDSRPVIIVNSGSLDFDFTISYTLTGTLAEGEHPLEIVFIDSDNVVLDLEESRHLAPGNQEEILVTWTLPITAGNEYQAGTARFNLLVNATQVTDQTSVGSSHYVFRNLSLSDFQTSGNWSQNGQGFSSNFGLLFIPNNQTTYTIIANNLLNKGLYSNGTSGGYGLLFETTVTPDGGDNGYILQFDRGYGAITIRRRINGSETSPIIRVDHRNFDFIPSDKNHPWWSQQHQIEIQVNTTGSEQSMKSVRVLIDNVVIIDNLQIDGAPQAANHVGLRAWHANSTFIDLSIQ